MKYKTKIVKIENVPFLLKYRQWENLHLLGFEHLTISSWPLLTIRVRPLHHFEDPAQRPLVFTPQNND